jgi:hypothetical protein
MYIAWENFEIRDHGTPLWSTTDFHHEIRRTTTSANACDLYG